MFLPMFLLAMLITVKDQSASRAAQKSAADFVTGLALLCRIHVMSCHEISLLWYPVKYITPPQRSTQPSNLLYLTLCCLFWNCVLYICTQSAGHRSARCALKFYFQILNIVDFHPAANVMYVDNALCLPAACKVVS